MKHTCTIELEEPNGDKTVRSRTYADLSDSENYASLGSALAESLGFAVEPIGALATAITITIDPCGPRDSHERNLLHAARAYLMGLRRRIEAEPTP